MTRVRRAVVIGLVGVVLAGTNVAAKSISDSLGNFVSNSLSVVAPVNFPNIAGEFIQRVAIGSLQLPVPANSTSFTFTYNPALGVFERSSGSLGPVFVDRGETVGEGKFDLIFSYQFANLTDLNGESFGEQLEFGFSALAEGDVPVLGAFKGRDLSLKQNVFSFNGTYGITDRWDVNLLVPIVYTTLDLSADSIGAVGDVASPIIGSRFHDDAFGIGDILLRTKYRFFDNPDIALMAAALTLRLPSGSEENFQGLGDVTLAPTLIVSRPIGKNDIHMNLGMEFNTADLTRSQARYSIGATLQPLDRLAFLIDILGSSGLDDAPFTVPITNGNVIPTCGPIGGGLNINCLNSTVNAAGTALNGFVPRSDIVDLSTGIKFNPFASANIYLLAIIPLTQQGLRAAVVPAGGFEWTF